MQGDYGGYAGRRKKPGIGRYPMGPTNIQGDYFNWPPLVQYLDDKTPTSQPEARSDEGFHGTSALVDSLASRKITLYNVTLLLCLYMCGEQMSAV